MVAAGRAALEVLGSPDDCPYERLEAASARLQQGIEQAAARHGLECTVHRQGSMLGLFFTAGPAREIASWEDVQRADRARFARVFHRLLARGIHLPPSAYEAFFLDHLSKMPGVESVHSSIALSTIKETTALPLSRR